MSGRMLITEAGRLAYYSNWFTEDSWGLNTPRFAKNLIGVSDIKSGNYDLIVAHCDIPLLDSKLFDLENDGTRGWDNQCKNIVNYIVGNSYQIYLVPFERGGNLGKWPILNGLNFDTTGQVHSIKCSRYDIYALSPNFTKLDDLKSLLQRYGAVKYSQEIIQGGGDSACF